MTLSDLGGFPPYEGVVCAAGLALFLEARLWSLFWDNF